MKFLVVDDDPSFRSMLSAALCHLGLGPVDEAENGREAVLKFIEAYKQSKPFTMIFLDYEMPVMNGREVFNTIRTFEQEHCGCADSAAIMLTSSCNDIEEIFGDVLSIDSSLFVLGKSININRLNNIFKTMAKDAPLFNSDTAQTDCKYGGEGSNNLH